MIDPRREAALRYDAETPPDCQVDIGTGEGCRVCAHLHGQAVGAARRQEEIRKWWEQRSKTADYMNQFFSALADPDHDWRKL